MAFGQEQGCHEAVGKAGESEQKKRYPRLARGQVFSVFMNAKRQNAVYYAQPSIVKAAKRGKTKASPSAGREASLSEMFPES